MPGRVVDQLEPIDVDDVSGAGSSRRLLLGACRELRPVPQAGQRVRARLRPEQFGELPQLPKHVRDLKRVDENGGEQQRVRAKLKMKFPTPNYRGLETAPGLIVIASDFRWTRAFPVLMDGSAIDQ